MKLDLKFDTLNDYLLNLGQVINQHANMLNNMDKNVLRKMEHPDVAACFDKIADNITLNNKML